MALIWIEDERKLVTDNNQVQGCIFCPQCGMVSYNPYDIANKYCGKCHQFHQDMPRLATETDRALLECLDLLMDLQAEGNDHSDTCSCDQCALFIRVSRLATKHEALWKRLQEEIAK